MVETLNCTNIDLKNGSDGPEVTLLQTHLKTLGYYTYHNGSYLKIDGIFGTYTEMAVKKFQKDTNHTQDGVFGPKTCPDLNKKILEKNGIIATNTTTGSSTQTTSQNTTTSSSYVNKYKINTANNVFKSSESNITIQGLYFIASKLKRTNELRSPDWKTLEMMDGSDYDYIGRENALKYSIEVYLTRDKYKKIRPELQKLAYQVCTVSTDLFPSGQYSVKVSPDDETVNELKITIDLKEYRNT